MTGVFFERKIPTETRPQPKNQPMCPQGTSEPATIEVWTFPIPITFPVSTQLPVTGTSTRPSTAMEKYGQPRMASIEKAPVGTGATPIATAARAPSRKIGW
jgi:hypothetical protein